MLFYPFPFVLVAIILIIYFRLASPHKYTVDWTGIVSSRGDRLPDFSYCGYHGSDISLPTIGSPNITVLTGNASDDISPSIQEAIDTLASSGGGVVELPPGRLSVSAGIQLQSNVVVTGSKHGETTLVLKEQPSEPVFILGSRGNATKAKYGIRTNITNKYIPIGSSEINVFDGSQFTVNQSVYVYRATTDLWLRYNGMLDLVRDGVSQTWISVWSLNSFL